MGFSPGDGIIVDTGSYSDPTWITSLAGSKITGSVASATTATTATTATALSSPGTSTDAILVDGAAGWADIIGDVRPKTTGSGTPSYVAWRSNIFGYAFVLNDLCDFVYHVPHDYYPSTDFLWHVHWSHNGTNISGALVFTYYMAIGKRDGVYTAEKTGTITISSTDITTYPQYCQPVNEEQISQTVASAARIATSDIEVDAILKIRLKVTTLPTITGGSLFVDTADIHYQSSGLPTKLSASPFYA